MSYVQLQGRRGPKAIEYNLVMLNLELGVNIDSLTLYLSEHGLNKIFVFQEWRLRPCSLSLPGSS